MPGIDAASTSLNGSTTLGNNLSVAGTTALNSSATLGNSLSVAGNTALASSLEIGSQTAPTLLLHSNTNSQQVGGLLQFRESNTAYGWNLRHNTVASENGSTDDRLVLERLNGSTPLPVMTWNQLTDDVTAASDLAVASTLNVSGSVAITSSLTVAGTMDIGLVTVVRDYTLTAGAYATFPAIYPNGTRLLSGGGDHRDFNSAQRDVTINFSGPDSVSPTSWVVRMPNSGSADRAVQVYYLRPRALTSRWVAGQALYVTRDAASSEINF